MGFVFTEQAGDTSLLIFFFEGPLVDRAAGTPALPAASPGGNDSRAFALAVLCPLGLVTIRRQPTRYRLAVLTCLLHGEHGESLRV